MTIEVNGPQPATQATEPTVTRFADPLRVPPRLKVAPHESLEVTMRATYAQLHSELAPTRVWAYDGHFPGPTIEVRRGQRLRVAWRNRVSGAMPLTAVELQKRDDRARS
jgi:o-aminophenol oxidase